MPQSLLFKNISVGYEHFFLPNFSIQLNGSFAPYQRLFNPYLHINVGEFGTQKEQETLHGYGFSLTPEFRFYFLSEKKHIYDIYLAPYLRYYHYFFQAKGGGERSSNRDDFPYPSYQFIGDGQRFAIRPGLQLGKIYPLGKHLQLDMWAGANMGKQKTQMKALFYEVKNMTDAELLLYATNISAAFEGGKAEPLEHQRILLSQEKIRFALRCGVALCYRF